MRILLIIIASLAFPAGVVAAVLSAGFQAGVFWGRRKSMVNFFFRGPS